MKTAVKAGKKVRRPGWDEYFLEISQLVSKRSTCLRRAVGAVLVKDKRILSSGYNGSPSGLKHCDEVGCRRAGLGQRPGLSATAFRRPNEQLSLFAG